MPDEEITWSWKQQGYHWRGDWDPAANPAAGWRGGWVGDTQDGAGDAESRDGLFPLSKNKFTIIPAAVDSRDSTDGSALASHGGGTSIGGLQGAWSGEYKMDNGDGLEKFSDPGPGGSLQMAAVDVMSEVVLGRRWPVVGRGKCEFGAFVVSGWLHAPRDGEVMFAHPPPAPASTPAKAAPVVFEPAPAAAPAAIPEEGADAAAPDEKLSTSLEHAVPAEDADAELGDLRGMRLEVMRRYLDEDDHRVAMSLEQLMAVEMAFREGAPDAADDERESSLRAVRWVGPSQSTADGEEDAGSKKQRTD